MKYIPLQRLISKLLYQDVHMNNKFIRRIPPLSTAKSYFSTEAEPTSVSQEDLQEQESDVEPELKKVPCPDNARLMKIAIIGLPNAGKSTIINALTNYNVCPVSHRPHTTRKNQKAVYLDENTQLVFVDTPGLVNVKEIKKFSFTPEFVFGPERSIGSSHVIAVVHDVSSSVTRDKLDFRIKYVLERFPDKKSVLILNKIDIIKRKATLLDTVKYLTCGIVGGKPLPVNTFEEKKKSHLRLDTETILAKAKERYKDNQMNANTTEEDKKLQIAAKFFSKDEIKKGIHQMGWPKFDDIFMISALQGDGVDMLRRYLVVNAVPENWLYDSETLTDMNPQKLVLSILRAKLLDYLPQEVPFKVQTVIDFWDETDSGILKISINIKCPKERYQYIILGTGGSLINRIINETERNASELLNRPIQLILNPVYDKVLAIKEKEQG